MEPQLGFGQKSPGRRENPIGKLVLRAKGEEGDGQREQWEFSLPF